MHDPDRGSFIQRILSPVKATSFQSSSLAKTRCSISVPPVPKKSSSKRCMILATDCPVAGLPAMGSRIFSNATSWQCVELVWFQFRSRGWHRRGPTKHVSRHPTTKQMTISNKEFVKHVVCAAGTGWKGHRRLPTANQLRSTRHSTLVVHLLVCSTIFFQDFDAVCAPQVWGVAIARSVRFGLRDVVGPVVNNQPLALRVWEHNEATAIRPRAAVRLADRALQWRRATRGHGMLASLGAASSGEIRRWMSEPPAGNSHFVHSPHQPRPAIGIQKTSKCFEFILATGLSVLDHESFILCFLTFFASVLRIVIFGEWFPCTRRQKSACWGTSCLICQDVCRNDFFEDEVVADLCMELSRGATKFHKFGIRPVWFSKKGSFRLSLFWDCFPNQGGCPQLVLSSVRLFFSICDWEYKMFTNLARSPPSHWGFWRGALARTSSHLLKVCFHNGSFPNYFPSSRITHIRGVFRASAYGLLEMVESQYVKNEWYTTNEPNRKWYAEAPFNKWFPVRRTSDLRFFVDSSNIAWNPSTNFPVHSRLQK